MSSCGSKSTSVGRQLRRIAAHLHGGVGLAGDDVGVGHHQARARRPSRCPRSRARTPCRAPARRSARRRGPPGAVAMPGGGGGTCAAGPVTDGSGSNRASAFRIGPDGGRIWLSSRRIAERWMSVRSVVEPVDSSATAPRIHAIPSPTQAVSAAPSRPSTGAQPGQPERRAGVEAEPLEPAGEHAPRQQRAEQPEQRCVLGVRRRRGARAGRAGCR